MVALVAALAMGGGVWAAPSDSARKAEVDQRLAEVQQDLSQARGRENVLTGQVSAYSDKIRQLEAELAPLRERAERLAAELTRLRDRLNALTARLETERRRLGQAEDTLRQRQIVLSDRLRALYARGEPDPLLVLIESGSFSGAVETADVLDRIVRQDRALADSVAIYADEVRATRDKIAQVRGEVIEAERQAEAAKRAADAAKAELERERAGQVRLRGQRAQILERARGDRATIEAEAEDLVARSAALGEEIRIAQAAAVAASAAAAPAAAVASPSGDSGAGVAAPSAAAAPSGSVSTGAVSSSGLAWPVSGPITSGFGPRWGRIHEGIDISGGSGTPIGAAAAGTVIIAGPQGGYGNLVVVDHGGGISTAYAHLSSFSVGVGSAVGQGSVVGGMGTTGNSTGVHLHFEVRVNGGAVDPLGYL